MNTNKIIAEKIAGEYAPKQTSKVEALIKLDKKVKQGPQIFALQIQQDSTNQAVQKDANSAQAVAGEIDQDALR